MDPGSEYETAGSHFLEGNRQSWPGPQHCALELDSGRTPIPSASPSSRELPWLSKVLWALGRKHIPFPFHPSLLLTALGPEQGWGRWSQTEETWQVPQNHSNGNYTEKWFGAAEVWTSGAGNLVWSWHDMLLCNLSLTPLSLSFLFYKMGIFIIGWLRRLNGKEYLNVLSLDSCAANASSRT